MNQNSIYKTFLSIPAAFSVLLVVFGMTVKEVLADGAGETVLQGLEETAGSGGAGYNVAATPSEFVGEVINGFLSALGIIFILMLVYAGFLYMTAAGDEGKVKKAKSILSSSMIGVILVVASYAISSFIISALVEAA